MANQNLILVINRPTEIDIMGQVYKVIQPSELNKNPKLKFLKFSERNIRLANESFEDNMLTAEPDKQNNLGPCQGQSNIFFKVRSSDNNRYLCCSRTHFPVRKHDAVFARAKLIIIPELIHSATGNSIHQGGRYYEFTQVPLGLAGTSQQAFFDNLASFSQGKIISTTADQLFNHLVDQYIKRLERQKKKKNLSALEMAFNYISYLAEIYRSFPASDLDGILGSISGKLAKTLLQRWYWYFLRRRLELLDLSRKTIRKLNELGYEMRRIYRLVMRNAFTILPLSLDEAINLKKLLNQFFTEAERQTAQVARKVYYYVTEKNWSGVPEDMVSDHIEQLIKVYKMVHDLNTVYFPFHYKAECLVAGRIKQAMRTLSGYQENIFFENQYVDLTEEQKRAIVSCLQNPLSVIKGGAGVGKTYVIEALAENLERLKIPYAIVSFTGKAVSRIEESVRSSVKPMTIHRLCYGGWRNSEPFRHLIIDEISMVTIKLMAMIYDRFLHDFALTLVGDINQLGPIEWGYFFKEILKYSKIPVVTLTKNLRVQGDPNNDGILLNSDKLVELIKADRLAQEGLNFDPDDLSLTEFTVRDPIITEINDQGEEVYQYLPQETAIVPSDREQARMRATILRQSFQFEPRHNFEIRPGGLDEVKAKLLELINQGVSSTDLMIITPFNRHLYTLNSLAQELFIVNKTKSICYGGVIYYPGDLVVMTINEYNIDIMHGTDGILEQSYEESNPYRRTFRKTMPYQSNCPISGYMQIKFMNWKVRRFFTNDEDYKIYMWAIEVFKYITLTDQRSTQVQPSIYRGQVPLTNSNCSSSQNNCSIINDTNQTDKNYYPVNSEIEWRVIMRVLNSIYHYYQSYPDSVADFLISPEFNCSPVKQLFLPLGQIKYKYSWAHHLRLSYAHTVHGAEGSERDHILGYTSSSDRSSSFLNYHLFYTLLTRARKGVSLIGNHVLFHSTALQPMELRYDRLAVRLIT